MTKYHYFARKKNGNGVEGEIEAESFRDVTAGLRSKGLVVISVKGIKEKSLKKASKLKRIKLTDSAFFFRQMATMISAGVTLTDSLRELSTQAKNPAFGGVIGKIREDIEKGNFFSETLCKYPRLFPDIITSMIRAGEEGGTLAEVMDQISIYLEEKIALRREVKAATVYPVIIAVFFGLALIFITFFLIPKFESMFAGFDITLPLLTRMVMTGSNMLFHALPLLIPAVIFLIIGGSWYGRTPPGRMFFDTIKIHLPLVGDIFHMVSIAYFCQTFSVLISSGVPVIKCLDIVGHVSGSSVVENASDKVKIGMEGGGSISSEMRKFKIFPPLLIRMIAVGEQTGKLDDMFFRINKFYKDEVLMKTKMLTIMLEPILLVGLGFVVGFVVVALYLPIFKLAGTMK